jgi:hypothetical protein
VITVVPHFALLELRGVKVFRVSTHLSFLSASALKFIRNLGLCFLNKQEDIHISLLHDAVNDRARAAEPFDNLRVKEPKDPHVLAFRPIATR